MPSALPFPCDFFCEHTPAKSRVFAVLASPGRPDTLKAVLTCADPVLAQRAASVLASLGRTGGGTMTDAEAERIHAALPAAPAASFREACQRLRDRQWPDPDASLALRDQVQARDEENLTPQLEDEEARTPSDARLAGLTGRAFRIIQFAEYHVYDAERLLQAATAQGWSPASAEDEDADSGDDLLDALMHMAGLAPDVPGADAICQETSAQELTADAGDELADWQQEPVTAEFGGGWRPRSSLSTLVEGLDDIREGLASRMPDFTSLFAVRSCDRDHADEDEEMECDICGDWQLTPRTADMLYMALDVLSDEAYDDVEEHGSNPVTSESADDWAVFRRLPRITRQTDADWRRQFARACEDLALDLAAGHWPIPRSNAEEMALHLAIEDAPGYLEMAQDSADKRHAALPEHDDDYTWDDCSELLFQDHDILMLFNNSLDGFEDPATDINKESGAGDLRPQAWFDFFANEEPRDPNRGFRR